MYTRGKWEIRKRGLTSEIFVETLDKRCSKEYLIASAIYKKDNACLIAAAPAMYEALKHISNIMANEVGSDAESVLRARDALAQANGK